MLLRRSGLFMAITLLCSAAAARDPKPGEPGYIDLAPARAAMQGASHSGSSPFSPPEETDSSFVVDVGPGLDTGCSFRGDGPLRFEIPVDRAFENGDDIQKLRDNGLISQKAIVRMPAYDIDFNGGGGGDAPERDRVFFNGRAVPEEFLTGDDGIWKLNTFQVPIEWVRFRQPGDSEPGRNEIRIDIDTANSDEVWCTAIDWASMSFQATRPVVMAHGILSNNSVWESVWVNRLAAKGVPVSSAVNPNMGNLDSIGSNAAKIAAAVNRAKQRWGVDKVNLVTHSKGGLDSRHYAEVSRSVDTLLQLGTPNAGSPLADYAQGIVLGLGGVRGSVIVNALAGPAGIQLTRPYMALYNRAHGYNPKVRYSALGGIYDPQCTFCGAAALNFLVGTGDTVVPYSSVAALPYIPTTAFASAGSNRDATHTVLEKSVAVFNRVGSRVATLPQAADATLPMEAGQHSETAVGTISAGQVQTRTVTVDQPMAMISMLYPSDELGMRLVSPSGRRIDPAVADADADIDFSADDIPGGRQAAYLLRNAERGLWTVEVAGTSGTDVDYAIAAWHESPGITLESGFARPAIATGQDLGLRATLRDQGVPLLGAEARALVVAPDGSRVAVPLRDDGGNGDAVAADGIYSGLQTAVTQPGLYRVLFVAEGISAAGHRFSRETFGLATASDGQVQVTGFRDEGRDTNGNGFFDALVVHADVQAAAGGQYRILAELTDGAGRTHQASLQQELAAGANSVPLEFDGRALYRNRTDGPYTLSTLRIAQENDIDLLPAVELEAAHATAAYDHRAFEHDLIDLTGTGTALGVDTSGNGLFDLLDVAVDVDLASAGYYSWSAQLSDRTGTRLGFFSGAAYLEAGRNSLLFSFPGEAIGANGEDGPYHVTDLLAFGAGASLVAENVFAAEPFQARQFEGYVRDTAPPVLQLTADPSQLWPPNHRMVPVRVKVDVQDDQDPQPVVTLLAVESNEADNGLGDGDTANDIQGAEIGTDDREVALRAERSGKGSGRVYRLTYQARDAAGNVSTASVTVTVPHSRR